MVKNPPSSAGDMRDEGPIPGLGRSSGGGNGNSIRYSGLESPIHGGTWWAAVPRVTESDTAEAT